MKIKIIAYVLAKLSHIFPNTFYVEVNGIDMQAPDFKATWHPKIVDRLIKML